MAKLQLKHTAAAKKVTNLIKWKCNKM